MFMWKGKVYNQLDQNCNSESDAGTTYTFGVFNQSSKVRITSVLQAVLLGLFEPKHSGVSNKSEAQTERFLPVWFSSL